MSAYGNLLVMIEEERRAIEGWHCPYCWKPMPEGEEVNAWPCCDEVGHAEKGPT